MNRGSLTRLLLQVSAFAFCTIVGALLSDVTGEEWVIAAGTGVGLIAASAVGLLLETKKPVTNQNKIESYPKRILFTLFC